MPIASIHPAGAVTIVLAALVVLALVYYLVATILELRKITAGLDRVIASVGEIVQKSAPVNDVVNSINGQLDAGVDLLEGCSSKRPASTHRPSVQEIAGGRGVEGPRRRRAAADDAGPGDQDGRGSRELRRLLDVILDDAR